MSKIRGIFATFASIAVLLQCAILPVSAATSPAAVNGYRVSPVRTDLTINPGSSQHTTIYVQNASNAVEEVQVIVNDFQPPTNESGNPALLLNGATAPRHSLKKFVTIPTDTLTLNPGEQKPIDVIVTVPANAKAGGYYGAVRVAPPGASGSKNVNLSGSVASLLLVTVPGDISEQLSIAGFGVTKGNNGFGSHLFFSNKDLQAYVRFQNGGDVQEQPFGKILLKKGSQTVGSYNVNDKTPPGNVLPDSIRRFNVKLDKVGWFGKYKAVGNFGYGTKGQLLTAQSTFYVIPLPIIEVVLLVILIVLFLVFGIPRMIRSHDRRVLAKHRR